MTRLLFAFFISFFFTKLSIPICPIPHFSHFSSQNLTSNFLLRLHRKEKKRKEAMEFNFWASRVHSTDQLSAVQASMLHSGNHIILDDSDGEDDSRAYFSCPYCYVDIEVQALCSHLQEEHCFDFRNAVCPLCAASLGKDVIGHFIAHHSSSIKRRRKPEKSVSSAFSSKKLTTKSRRNKNGSAPDPLLPFICRIPFSDLDSVERDDRSENDASIATNVESNESPLLERNQENSEELNQRASFVQQLITSTIF